MSNQRVGPKVKVRVEYECNGCQYHGITEEDVLKLKHHTCSHPAVIEEHSCPQFIGCGHEVLTAGYPCSTPKWLCPYIEKEGK